jgi:SAM-dependent methyltransferase
MGILERIHGQSAYGDDPENYDAGRPPYPQKVFDLLQQRCGLRAGAQVLEIGPGTGQSTRELLQLGATVTAVEPDERLATFLVQRTEAAAPLRVITSVFEKADLPSNAFDLVTCASAFHWLDEMQSLKKIAALLNHGGSWAVWWNLFFDNSRTDELHRATSTLFGNLDLSPAAATEGRPSFALDRERRIANLKAIGSFHNIFSEIISWTITLDTAEIRRLYSTFSPIRRLDEEERSRLLDGLAEIVDKDFAGKAQISMNTPFYSAQRHK